MSTNNNINEVNNAARADEAEAGKAVGRRSHVAGAFDIRNVIGSLLGIYGLVLLVSFLLLDPGVDVDTGAPKDSIYNLWAGLAMVVVAVLFGVWTKVDPIKIEEPVDAEGNVVGAPVAVEDK